MSEDSLPSQDPELTLFRELTVRAGLKVTDDAEQRMFRGYMELKAMTAQMRIAQPETDEPALIFATPRTLGGDNG